MVLTMVIEGREERQTLNVVPVKVRDENVSGKRPLSKFFTERLAEDAKTCAAIENVKLIPKAYFDAGGITSIAHILRLRSGR